MSWQFARTPKWLVRHVLVVALLAVMVNLGLWQLRRLEEKRDYKALVEARVEEPAQPIDAVLPASADVDDPSVEAVLHRRVTASGRYDDEGTAIVENRTLNGAAGGWVLTPLVLDDGTAVLVLRGFIGFDREGQIVPPPAPDGEVTLDGLLEPSQERGRFGAGDPQDGEVRVLARVDLDRYAEHVAYDVLPAYVQLASSDPPEAEAPEGAPQLVALGLPEPEEGPHLSYAVQWFIFSTIAAGGYVLLLRKVASERVAVEA